MNKLGIFHANQSPITLSEIKRDFPMEFPFFDSKT